MNSFKIFLLILLAGINLTGCKDFLSPTPDNNYTKERFLNDPTWALGLVINGYTSAAYPRVQPFDEVATDDAVTNDQANSYLRMATGEWSALYVPNSVWYSSYVAITYMNYFHTLVDDVEWSWQDTIKNRLFRDRLKGEAYGFKGFYYTRLLQQFGGKGSDGTMLGVPIINTVMSQNDDWKIQRSTYQETVNQIASDLGHAVRLMPYVYVDKNGTDPATIAWNQVNGRSINLNRMDGRAALALKARMYLMASSPAYNGGTAYNQTWADSAAKIAARLINRNGGLATSVGPDPIYWDNDLDTDNTDILWRNDRYQNNTVEAANFPPSLYGNGRVNPTQNLVDAYPMKNGYPITDPLSLYDPANPYANRDPRLNKDILFNGGRLRITGSIGSNNQINTQADNPAVDRNDGLRIQTNSTRTGYYLKKLMRAATVLTPGSATSLYHVYPLVRWTEVLLIYAEAANEVYGPDADGGNGFTARQVIEAIRKRGAGPAGAGPATDPYLTSLTTKEQMRQMIRNERRIELSFEGVRFWDLRRWNVPLAELAAPAKGVRITGTTPKVYDYTESSVNPVEPRAYEAHMYYGPIPNLETKKYPGFIQNQGW